MALFPTLVALHLSVHTMASRDEMYNIGYCNNKCLCGYVFPTFIILHLSMPTSASLQELYNIGYCRNICLCVSRLYNSPSLGVHRNLPTRKVQHRLMQSYIPGCLCVFCLDNSTSFSAHIGLIVGNV